MHRRQWVFCLLCIPLHSKLQLILFGAPSPSHTHPIQVLRGGWLTGVWLKPVSLRIPCHLMSCGSLSQTQKPLNTPTRVFLVLNFFFLEPLERNSNPAPKLSRICTHQEQQCSEAVPKSDGSSEIICPVQEALTGDSKAEFALGPQLLSWDATRLLLTSPHGQEQAATIISTRWVSTACLDTRPAPVPQLSHITPERTGTIHNSNSAHTCPDGRLASSWTPVFLADLHPPGRKCQMLEWQELVCFSVHLSNSCGKKSGSRTVARSKG